MTLASDVLSLLHTRCLSSLFVILSCGIIQRVSYLTTTCPLTTLVEEPVSPSLLVAEKKTRYIVLLMLSFLCIFFSVSRSLRF